MDKTTLVFVDWLGDMIYGYNVSQVTVRDLHLTRSSPGTTQGWVRAVTTGQVVLEIPPGNYQGQSSPLSLVEECRGSLMPGIDGFHARKGPIIGALMP